MVAEPSCLPHYPSSCLYSAMPTPSLASSPYDPCLRPFQLTFAQPTLYLDAFHDERGKAIPRTVIPSYSIPVCAILFQSNHATKAPKLTKPQSSHFTHALARLERTDQSALSLAGRKPGVDSGEKPALRSSCITSQPSLTGRHSRKVSLSATSRYANKDR